MFNNMNYYWREKYYDNRNWMKFVDVLSPKEYGEKISRKRRDKRKKIKR